MSQSQVPSSRPISPGQTSAESGLAHSTGNVRHFSGLTGLMRQHAPHILHLNSLCSISLRPLRLKLLIFLDRIYRIDRIKRVGIILSILLILSNYSYRRSADELREHSLVAETSQCGIGGGTFSVPPGTKPASDSHDFSSTSENTHPLAVVNAMFTAKSAENFGKAWVSSVIISRI